MLKLIYTDDNFRLERLAQSLEIWIKSRIVLALRTTHNFYLEPSSATFLVLRHSPLMADLQAIQGDYGNDVFEIVPCDLEYAEVQLHGHWITSEGGYCTGMFVCVLGDRPESLLEQIWQASQHSVIVAED
ncbi:MAG: alr0857 family protein [Limnothrix sp.]